MNVTQLIYPFTNNRFMLSFQGFPKVNKIATDTLVERNIPALLFKRETFLEQEYLCVFNYCPVRLKQQVFPPAIYGLTFSLPTDVNILLNFCPI